MTYPSKGSLGKSYLAFLLLNKVKLDCDCNYFYHQNCIDRWKEIKNECPICKKVLDNGESNEYETNNIDINEFLRINYDRFRRGLHRIMHPRRFQRPVFRQPEFNMPQFQIPILHRPILNINIERDIIQAMNGNNINVCYILMRLFYSLFSYFIMRMLFG